MKKFTQATLIALLLSSSVFSQTKNEPVKNPSGGTIVNQASDSWLILLSPADGKLFNSSEGSKPVLFRWTGMVPKPKEAVTYRLKVWQLMQGQSGTEAIRSNQPIVTKDVVNITQAAISNLYTGPCKPPFLCNFIWAVEVFNSEGISIGNSYAGTGSYSFKFEVENTGAVKAEANNKGNAGNTGMSGGKSLNANGDPVHGVDVKLGVKSASSQGDPVHGVDVKLGAHAINLPVEKIIYDAEGNIVAMATKSKTGEINVLIDEVRVLGLSKNQIERLKISNEDYLKALHKFIETGEANSAIGWPIECWQVRCTGSCGMGPSCPGKAWRCKWVGFVR